MTQGVVAVAVAYRGPKLAHTSGSVLGAVATWPLDSNEHAARRWVVVVVDARALVIATAAAAGHRIPGGK